MIVLSHPTGNTNSSAAACGLNRHEYLSAYYTCVSWNSSSRLARLLPRSVNRLLNRRQQVEIPAALIRTRPFRELMRNILEATRIQSCNVRESALFSTEQVYYDLDRHAAAHLGDYPNVRGVYAYDDGALEQFRMAQTRGLKCVYDMPIGHWRALRAITREEHEAKPDWAGTMKALTDTDEKTRRKDEEIDFADLIVVASTFAKRTLDLYPKPKQVVVIPYGMPEAASERRLITHEKAPLRLLFVGQLTQRKGISYLLDAVKMMGRAVTLTLVGTKGGACKLLDDACVEHRWIETLPHPEVLEEMRRHDVFVFPSLFEGFGLTIGEALSQGLPVITTSNTGAPDIIQDGVEGFILPVRSVEAMVSKLELLHGDRHLLKCMSDAALTGAKRMTWEQYGDAIAAVVSKTIGMPMPALSSEQVDRSADRIGLRQEFLSGGVTIRR
jgi:starch synthase